MLGILSCLQYARVSPAWGGTRKSHQRNSHFSPLYITRGIITAFLHPNKVFSKLFGSSQECHVCMSDVKQFLWFTCLNLPWYWKHLDTVTSILSLEKHYFSCLDYSFCVFIESLSCSHQCPLSVWEGFLPCLYWCLGQPCRNTPLMSINCSSFRPQGLCEIPLETAGVVFILIPITRALSLFWQYWSAQGKRYLQFASLCHYHILLNRSGIKQEPYNISPSIKVRTSGLLQNIFWFSL